MKNLRILNVAAALIISVLGFVFQIAYHDGDILVTGIFVSIILTSNYFFSFYSKLYKDHFQNISNASIFLIHFWVVYVAYMRQFDVAFLLPVALSIFIFSLAFDRFYKSLFFIFTITSAMLAMMWFSHHWQVDYTIAVITLYSGAFVSNIILRRKKEYHREIDKREKQYASLVENMNDGLIYISASEEVRFVNEEFCRITGYNRDELVGKALFVLNRNCSEYEAAKQFLEELRKGNSGRCESTIVTKNNEEVWIQLSGSPIYDDEQEQTGSMVVFTDISDLKTIQDQLKKREEGYRTFIDQSAVGIWRAEYKQPIDVNMPVNEQIELLLNTGKISEANDFMAKMYGYLKSDELIGRRIRDFYYLENNFDEEKTRDFLTSFISNNYRISNAESKEMDRAGNIRYILNNNIGIVENGFLVRTWGVQTDITDRKKTEHELMESNQELDTFFYKASHDLKGPLASILGIVNLARLENKEKVIEKYFSMIDTSVRRLDRTLMDLIELARTRKGVSKLSKIYVRALVDEILQSLSHTENYPRIKFEIEVDGSIGIMADKVLVLSVFQNLIHNAINYGNKENPSIKIRVDGTDSGIKLEVTDNGKGIADHVKHRVFEMFYRGHPDSSGSGLGLFIVKNAIEKLKGKVWFDSEDGKGASFYAEIPNAAP
ncbi:MAG: PAS domain S-box protein [Bacteroidetes bacterium]|nr:PAS domain S-box protein [Bacteroidota bacterium]